MNYSLLFLHQNTENMKALLFIFLGGGIGSVLRYLISMCINQRTAGVFPWGTLAVNISGCVLIGFFYALSSRMQISNEMRLLLTIGLCGGFTTFSTFGNESLQLLKSGLYLSFFAYVCGSLILGISGVMLGTWFGNKL